MIPTKHPAYSFILAAALAIPACSDDTSGGPATDHATGAPSPSGGSSDTQSPSETVPPATDDSAGTTGGAEDLPNTGEGTEGTEGSSNPDGGAGPDGGPSTEGLEGTATPEGTAGGEPPPAPSLAISCAGSPASVYTTPTGLPPFAPEARGAIVRCATALTADKGKVEAAMQNVPGLAVRSGYAAYLIAYRTERVAGVQGVGTARVWLPSTPMPGPLPVIVATHGTAGLADICAPSQYPAGSSDIAVPWVASGYPVVAPDYAGLGNEGTQGYANTVDTAHSALDAARAVLALVTPGALSGEVIVAGHSQGGGVALGSQALAQTYGGEDFTVTRVVSFASGYPHESPAPALRFPNAPISGAGGVTRAVTSLMLYADFANLFGEARAADGLHPDIRDFVRSAIESKCIFDIVDALAQPAAGYTPPNTIGAVVDPQFRTDVVDCLNGKCANPDAEAWVARADAANPHIDPAGAPVLMITGENDVQQPPAAQACVRDQLVKDGATVTNCVIPGVDHMGVVEASIAYAIGWALHGQATCPFPNQLPACKAGP